MKLILPILFLTSLTCWAQSNMVVTNPLVEEIMLGNYAPADYEATEIIDNPQEIIAALQSNVSPEMLKNYLLELNIFETRHTASDTLSDTNGFGAARRWAIDKFTEWSEANENRLIPFYLQFDEDICDMGQHRNACAILPGMDATNPSIVIIEAHMDSRCAEPCDVTCTAMGMEDNASGTALVIELARVMSQFSFDHSIVFMCTTGEEQGLFGAAAFADYCTQKGIEVKAVFNNDIVGGIICGETSSAPSCPGLGDVDSTQVRLFSASGKSKQLSRFNKLQYKEELENLVTVPMLLTIMTTEDRAGRGGDHIPFRQNGFAAMRFTSANEHGNANASDPDYHDRQHTSEDILGVDTDGDMVLDSFFVNFNYLSRNAVINGVAAGMAALGPETPDFEGYRVDNGDSLVIEIIDDLDYMHYRVFSRTNLQDFDTIYTLIGSKSIKLPYLTIPSSLNFISVAAVDADGIESLFTDETFLFPILNAAGELIEESMPETNKLATLYQNRPNPFDEATAINFFVHDAASIKEAYIGIFDMNGREIDRIATAFKQGMNEVVYTHGYNQTGTFLYSLVVDGRVIESRRMIFAN